MRRLIFTALAALTLSGCASMIESAFDDHAREECDQTTRGSARGGCYDRVEQNRREHE